MRKVVAAIAPARDDLFIEIGPGRGALTLPLADRVRRVRAIELDAALACRLESLAPASVEVVRSDFLRVDLAAEAVALRRGAATGAVLRLAGNLPYAASAPILLRLLREAAAVGLRDAVVMLQREVAERVVAAAGSRAYGPLAVMAALRADVRRLLDVPPGAFRPAPRVHSAVVSLRFRAPARTPLDEAGFEFLVRRLFTRRRKQLVNALSALDPARTLDARAACRAAGLSPTCRPEVLDLRELVALSDVLGAQPRVDA